MTIINIYFAVFPIKFQSNKRWFLISFPFSSVLVSIRPKIPKKVVTRLWRFRFDNVIQFSSTLKLFPQLLAIALWVEGKHSSHANVATRCSAYSERTRHSSQFLVYHRTSNVIPVEKFRPLVTCSIYIKKKLELVKRNSNEIQFSLKIIGV